MVTKCVCGYVHEDGFDTAITKYNPFIQGDELFIRVHGSFFYSESEDFYHDKTELKLLACPKCGTLQVQNA